MISALTFLRKRLVNFCTKRFRGNAVDLAAGAITIQVDARSAEEYADKVCEEIRDGL